MVRRWQPNKKTARYWRVKQWYRYAYKTHNKSEHQFVGHQSGMVLIVVLLLLVVLSSIALLAIKESHTGLKVTTAMQADTLLFQANDTAFFAIERQLTQTNNNSGLLPFLLSDTVAEGEQIIMCMRDDNRPFSVNNMTHRLATGGVYVSSSANGFCDVTRSSDYHNAGRVITQMHLTVMHKPNLQTPSNQVSSETTSGMISTDSVLSQDNSNIISCLDIAVQMTSIIPITSVGSDVQINACLQQETQSVMVSSSLQSDEKTVVQCLADNSVFFMSHQQNYQVMTLDASYPLIENSLHANCLAQVNEQADNHKTLAIIPTAWRQIMP